MISRRDFLQTTMAAAALYGGSGFGNWGRLAAQQSLTQSKLLEFDTFGNVSLIHVTDIHAQMKPIFFRAMQKFFKRVNKRWYTTKQNFRN